ncbi:MAG TPA: HEAT repeat domain-containing protein [Phycisphaerales bacterium]|nr:HEAT repeat domain-containing protein [Phycisphaerales bacterium]HMP37758.1 HEAT repeat domain-containing protein [Phycisphaerales bacterium]
MTPSETVNHVEPSQRERPGLPRATDSGAAGATALRAGATRPSASRVRRLCLAALAAPLFCFPACVGRNSAPAEAWSTKGQSAVTPAGDAARQVRPVRPAGPAPAAGAALGATIAVVAEGDRDRALAILEAAATHPSPLVRANAIEALASDRAGLRAAVQGGLADRNRGVRFVSAMAVGMQRLDDVALLVEPLRHDESLSVQAAAIFALLRTGRPVDPTPLAAMMLSDDPEVRGNAAFILGELGNPSALPVLDNSLGRGMELVNPARVRIVELQVAEAQVRLGETRAADPIRAALFAPGEELELTALACQMVGRIGDERATTSLRRLVEADGIDARPPEVRLAAIAALAQMRGPAADFLPVAESLASSERPDVRALAANAIGALGDPRGAETLRRLMSDVDPVVQTAASGAMIRVLSQR